MKLFLAALLGAVIALVGSHFIVSKTDSASVKKETVYERILRKQTIHCGYTPWEPGLVKDPNTGAFSGPMHDFTMELGRQLGLKIEWAHELNIATYLEDLNTGKFDLECAGGFANAQRGKYVMYSKPYMYMPTYAYVRADDERFTDNVMRINEPDVTVAVMDGDYAAHYREKSFPQSKVLQLPASGQFSDMMLAVIYKKADVALFDAMSAKPINEANPGKLKRIPVLLRAIPANFSIPRDEINMKAMIDTATDEIVDSGFVDTMVKKYGLEKAIVPVALPYKTN